LVAYAKPSRAFAAATAAMTDEYDPAVLVSGRSGRAMRKKLMARGSSAGEQRRPNALRRRTCHA